MANKVEIKIDGKNKGAITAINGVDKALLKTEGQVVRTDSKFRSSFGSMGSLVSKFATQLKFMGVAAVSAFGLLIKKQIDYMESLDKLSQRIGFSVEALSTLKFAGGLAGIEFESLSTGLSKFSKNLFDVKNGLGQTAVKGFEALGISATDANGRIRETEELLPEVANRFAQMKDGTEKTAIAMTLFGRSGKELIPLLNAGAIGLRKMQQEARGLGLEISTSTAKRAADLKDNMLRLESSLTGVELAITEVLLPPLTQLSESLIVMMAAAKGARSELDALATVDPKVTFLFKSLKFIFKELPIQWLSLLLPGVGQFKVLKDLYNEIAPASQSFADSTSTTFINVQQMSSLFPGLIPSVAKVGDQWGTVNNNINRTVVVSKSLQKQWETTAKTLKRDILLSGLTPMGVKMQTLVFKVQDLKDKYGQIPGALSVIDAYYDNLIAKQLTLANAQRGLKQPDKIPKLQPTDFVKVQDEDPMQNYIKNTMSGFEMLFNSVGEQSEIMRNMTADSFGMMGQAADTFFRLSGERNKAAFVAFKAFSIAEAIINTFNGATKALAQGGFFGFAMAAAVIASGLAHVAKIASTQPTSAGGAAGGGVSSAPVLQRSSAVTNNTTDNSSRSLTIKVYVNGVLTDGTDMTNLVRDHIVPKINKAIGDGMRIDR